MRTEGIAIKNRKRPEGALFEALKNLTEKQQLVLETAGEMGLFLTINPKIRKQTPDVFFSYMVSGDEVIITRRK